MTTYFNNANGNKYEVLAKYFDAAMLLKTESNNFDKVKELYEEV